MDKDTPPFDVELFVKEVKRHPVLWDSKHPNFNHRKAKTSSWEDVALNVYADSEDWSNYDKFGKVRDIQKRWKNMRDNYVKEVRYEKKVQQGLAVAKRKRYVYAHLLEFLTPKQKLPSKSSSEKSSTSSSEEEEDGNEEMECAETKNNSSELFMLVDEGYSSSHVNQFCKTSLGSQNHLEAIHATGHNSHCHINSPELTSKNSENTNAQTSIAENNSHLNYLEQYSLRNISDPPSHPDYSSHYSHKNVSDPSSSSRVVPAADFQFESPPISLEQDDDKMFLLSLLPYFKKFGGERKLQARIKMTQLLHDMLYKQT